jgi:hypothetical protein
MLYLLRIVALFGVCATFGKHLSFVEWLVGCMALLVLIEISIFDAKKRAP